VTLYLLDANVLIRAHADYYPIDRIKPFWDWLLLMAQLDKIQMPREIYEEVAKSRDLLGQWLRRPDVRGAIILADGTDQQMVASVMALGYGPDLTDIDYEKMGRDPFLIAAARQAPDRVVVTRELSKPSAQKGNRKVPDVCAAVGVSCINDFELWRLLDFRIE
jgi:hypothetical protein